MLGAMGHLEMLDRLPGYAGCDCNTTLRSEHLKNKLANTAGPAWPPYTPAGYIEQLITCMENDSLNLKISTQSTSFEGRPRDDCLALVDTDSFGQNLFTELTDDA